MVKNMIDTGKSPGRVIPEAVTANCRPAWPGFFPFRLPGVLLAAVLIVSCLPQPVPTRPSREGLAEVQAYLQPVPPEARRINWTLADLSAIRLDGTLVPLSLHTGLYQGSALEGKQTLLASGFVPPGSYSGLRLTISSAGLKGEEGDTALYVPEAPLVIKTPFEAAPSGVLPLFLSLDPGGLLDGGYAFSPDFSMALPDRELTSLIGYLAMADSDQVTVFNRKTLNVTGAVSTGRDPRAIAIDPARGRAYVAVTGDDTVEVIDVLDSSVRERIILHSGDKPVDLDLSADGLILLTANFGSGTVSLLDPEQAVETDRIEVGRGPTSVTVNGSGTRAYVTCSLSGTVSVIDLTSGALSATLAIEETEPLAAVLDGKGENLFVVGGNSPNVTVVDPAALSVTSRIYVGTGCVSVAVDELSGLAFVGRKSSSEIAVVDPSVRLPVDFIRLKDAPGQMAVDLQEKALMVILPGKRVLQKVDLVSRRIMAEMDLDSVPTEVAFIE